MNRTQNSVAVKEKMDKVGPTTSVSKNANQQRKSNKKLKKRIFSQAAHKAHFLHISCTKAYVLNL